MKLKIVFLKLLLLTQLSHANGPLEISILTCSAGEELSSLFGHSAIRIVDHQRRTDIIYDFGTFNFDTPNFAVKFLKGKLKYHLSLRPTDRFIRTYTLENRLITEQKLDLSHDEKQTILTRLQFLYRPENRYYYYSFLEKDCSTDLRDLLTFVGVDFDHEVIQASKRDLINTHLNDKRWLRLGVNMILGNSLDVKASRFESMFLPEYLKAEIDLTSYKGTALVKSEHDLNKTVSVPQSALDRLISPLIIFSVLALLVIFWCPKPLLLTLSTVVGLTGLLIVTLWLFSEHVEFRNNYNLLWCSPLYLLYLPLIATNRSVKTISIALLVMLLITFLVWALGIQSFDIGMFPLLVVLGLLNWRALRLDLAMKKNALILKEVDSVN